MEFLVAMEVNVPHDVPADRQQRLRDAEAQRAQELAHEGVLVRLWRTPGRRANWGLWRAEDATELHAAIASLPLFPYLDVHVTPLAQHPNDPAIVATSDS